MSRKVSKRYKKKMTAIRKVAVDNDLPLEMIVSLMKTLTHSRKVSRWRKRGFKEVEVPTGDEFMGRESFEIMYEVHGKLVSSGMRRIDFDSEATDG